MKQKKYLISLSLIFLMGCQRTEFVVSNDFDIPYINITQYEFTTQVGVPLDFSNVTGYDDIDGMLPVSVEGYINYNKEGEYYPSLVCIDTSGNENRTPITIYVVSEYDVEANANLDASNYYELKCRSEDAEDAEKPCKYVSKEKSRYYDVLYLGEDGIETCVNDSNLKQTCEVIYANDKSIWGYGRREKTEEELEEE